MKMYEPLSHGGIQGYQNNSIFVLDKIVEIIIISHKSLIFIFNKSIIILPLIIKVKVEICRKWRFLGFPIRKYSFLLFMNYEL